MSTDRPGRSITLPSFGAPPPPTAAEILADAEARKIPVVDRTVDATADDTAAQAAATLDSTATPVSGTVSVHDGEPNALGHYSIVPGKKKREGSYRHTNVPQDIVAVPAALSAAIVLRVRDSVAPANPSKTAPKAPAKAYITIVPAPKSDK